MATLRTCGELMSSLAIRPSLPHDLQKLVLVLLDLAPGPALPQHYRSSYLLGARCWLCLLLMICSTLLCSTLLLYVLCTAP